MCVGVRGYVYGLRGAIIAGTRAVDFGGQSKATERKIPKVRASEQTVTAASEV